MIKFDVKTGKFIEEPIENSPPVLRFGDSPPAEDLGKEGDLYIDTSAMMLYGPKTETWGEPKSMRGNDGRDGKDGESIKGEPGQSIKGDKGDSGESIVGPKGDDGKQGIGIRDITQPSPEEIKISLDDDRFFTFNLSAGKDGKDGEQIQLRANQTHVQWKKENEKTWRDLFAIPKSRRGGGGGIHYIKDASDVSVDGVTNGQGIAWNAATEKWEPVTLGGGGAWGSITGTLSDQTDLQAALDDKADASSIITDHGALTGLADDDHTQYHNDTRADTWLATKTLTETWSVFDEIVSNRTITICLKVPFAGTITETTSKCTAGTATATFAIEGTPLGGTANSVSTSEQSQTQSSSNTFAVGDAITVVITAASSCRNMALSITYTRGIS